jgi:outer membrane protein assembly factor BamB
VDRELESADALRAWVAQQPWTDPATAEKVLAAVPNTKIVGADVALCLDLRDGKELWRFEAEGLPAGRVASVTPAVVEGRLYTALSTKVYCLDAATGKEIWSAAVGTKRGIATSPLVAEGLVIVHNGRLCALDAATGREVWTNGDVRVANGSPVVWKDFVLCNTDHDLVALEMETGKLRWKQPAGGDSTPVVSGDRCVVVGKTEGHNFAAYALSPEGARNLWTKSFTARRYAGSPVILDGHAYHFCSARHLCVDLETGETKWEVERQSNLSSPVFADGKFLVYENNGGFLAMVDPDPAAHRIVGRAKTSALGCATPALHASLAVVRTKDRLVCLDLSQAAPAP